ncbi:beta-microseminoprotein [Octodon degus]|uniref:Beta-microseminoprotein n=1 Tax=Octodon degus TaxID=10160 RepID=A0A6P3V8V4_OCTDE|nr:beta-microseminoprotein [Octodon degus]
MKVKSLGSATEAGLSNAFGVHISSQIAPDTGHAPTGIDRAVLGCLFILTTFVASCNTFHCSTFLYTCENGPPTECKDSDGVSHPINSTWMTKNCENCTCNEVWMKCCSIITIPVNYNTTKCHAVFHQDNCTYSVVEREDPEKSCDVGDWILL